MDNIDEVIRDLDSITTVPYCPFSLRNAKPPDIFFGPDFFTDLNSYKSHRMVCVDVLTYTVSEYAPLHLSVNRILKAKGEYFPCRESRLLFSHSKIYIVHSKRSGVVRPLVAYIGSQNLVAPTIPELMVKVPRKTAEFCAILFNYYWDVAGKSKKGKH